MSWKSAAIRPKKLAPPRTLAIAKAIVRRTGVYGYHQSSRFALERSSRMNGARVSSASAYGLLVTPEPLSPAPTHGACGSAAVKPWLLMVTTPDRSRLVSASAWLILRVQTLVVSP